MKKRNKIATNSLELVQGINSGGSDFFKITKPISKNIFDSKHHTSNNHTHNNRKSL